MIRRILILAHKDLRVFLADPVAIGLSFVVPLVMIVVFGMVFGRSGSSLDKLPLLAVSEDTGPAGARLLRDLNQLDAIEVVQKLKKDSTALDSTRARTRVERGDNSAALILPRDFSEGLKKGQVRASLLVDPRDPVTANVVSGLLQRQVFSTFPGLMPLSMMNTSFAADSTVARSFNSDIVRAVERNFGVKIPETPSLEGVMPEQMVLGSDPDSTKSKDTSGFSFDKAMSAMFNVKTEQVVGKDIVNPGIAQSVAGPAVLFLMFAMGAIAAALLREMQWGTAPRLLVSGATPGELLTSRYLYAVCLGSAQLIVMLLFGWIVFHLQVFDHPGALLVMIVCTAAATSGLALIVAAISRSEEQATGFQIVLNLGMSAIGGAMFPSFIIPAAIRTIAKVTPVHWAMQGFLNIFWRDQSLSGILLESGILLGMALVLVTTAVILFRKRLAVELG